MMELFDMSQPLHASVNSDGETVTQLENFNCDKKNMINPLTCMACQVYFESRGEPLAGQLAVAKVTLKRANGNSKYVCAKVYEKKRSVCQFSWACDGKKHVMVDVKAVRRAVKIAKQAFKEGPDRYDHFYATYINEPFWAKNMECKMTGRHIFCDGNDVAGYKKVPAVRAIASHDRYAGL